MTTNAVRLTCAGYLRLTPLITGEVAADGVDLSLVAGALGSWPERAEMLRRALQDPSVQGGEASMGVHLKRMDQGDRSFVALPVFVLRNFVARDLYVRAGSALHHVSDLAGKRIGMYSWTASGSIWYRHFLAWAGVDFRAVQWCIGSIDRPTPGPRDPALPPEVGTPTRDKSLAQMLLDGELDALFSPPRPEAYHPATGPIVRLLSDSRAVERRFFQDTGLFPPQHLVVLRREAWEADKALAHRITDAFVRCEAHVQAGARSFPYVSPWLEQDMDEAELLMGGNPYAHGLEPNRAAMEAFCAEGHRLGLTTKRVAVDDYFAEYLAS